MMRMQRGDEEARLTLLARRGDEAARRQLQDLQIGAAPRALEQYADPGQPEISEFVDPLALTDAPEREPTPEGDATPDVALVRTASEEESAEPAPRGGIVVTESQRVAAMAAMAARNPRVEAARESVATRREGYGAGSTNVTYTYEDAYKLRLHKGNADWWIELTGPDRRSVGRVASMGRSNQHFQDPDARRFRERVY
jgi:hypothetical protein